MQKIKTALFCSVIMISMTSQVLALDCESEVMSAEKSVTLANETIKTVEKASQRSRIRILVDDANMFLLSAKSLCKRPKASSLTKARAMARALAASGSAKAAVALAEDYKNPQATTP